MHVITQSGVLFLWMHMLTLVTSQECTLQQFLNGPLFDSNFNTTGLDASYAVGKQVRVSCNVGYSGFFTLICVEGNWQSKGTRCEPQQCPVIHVDDNIQVIGDLEEATYGNVVRFSCKSNAEILTGSTVMYCDESGEWNGQHPKCHAVKCTVPMIENGYVPGDIQEYREHDILHFKCIPTYTNNEARPTTCMKQGLRADWSPTPLCEPNVAITCRLTLPPLEGTRYEPASINLFTSGDTLSVFCGQRHWIRTPQESSAVTTCTGTGQWSIEPVCQEVRCRTQYYHYADIDGIDQQEYRYDEKVGYVCKEGYKGRFSLTCRANGWIGTPQCTMVTCRTQYYQNADIDGIDQHEYRYNDKVVYVCKEGYEGRFSLTCRENGWTGTPQCTTSLGCGKPPNLLNGDTKETLRFQHTHGERVEFICQRYYTMEGEPYKNCSNGEWLGQMRCLRPCTVDQYAMNTHNIEFLHTSDSKLYLTHNDAISFRCKDHRSPVGTVGMRQLCIDGVIHLPTCQ